MRADRKAERQTQREVRRRDREVRKQANEIVLVPVQEWQTLWSEPHLALTGRSRVHHGCGLFDFRLLIYRRR